MTARLESARTNEAHIRSTPAVPSHREPVCLEGLSERERDLATRLNRVIEEADIAERLLGQFRIDLDGTNTLYQKNLRALGAFRRLTSSLMGKSDLHLICKEVVAAITEEVGAERCSIMLLKDQVLRLEAAASSAPDTAVFPEAHSRVFLVGEGVAGEVVRTGIATRIDDVEGDPRWVSLKNAVAVRSILCLPLRTTDEAVFGVVNLSHTQPGFFTTEHMRLLDLICPVVSQLISFAQFHAALRTANSGLEDRLKDLEEQFRASQKMEAIGTLAGGVAHDFNNILTAITCYAQLLLDGNSRDSSTHEHATEIQRAAERAASLTSQLLAFSRRQMLAPRVINLNSVIENTANMLQRLIGEHIQLSHVGEADLGSVRADPGQMEQVIVNFAVNARDAMPGGGRLIIQTANTVVDDLYIDRHVRIPPGQYVVLMVSDTGTGMDSETQRRIFEPFFTTKEQGKGTGLGLSTVHGIVNQSEGHVTVYSELGRGTTFKVYLPRVRDHEDAVSEPVEAFVCTSGSATILLAEDDEGVRKVVKTLLTRQGYQVLAAGTGEEALDICAGHTGRIDLLLTDMVMPGMTGPELASRLRSAMPETSVIFMSGYADQAILQQGFLEPGSVFVQKPFTAESLSRKIRDVLRHLPGALPAGSSGAPDGAAATRELVDFCTADTIITNLKDVPPGVLARLIGQ